MKRGKNMLVVLKKKFLPCFFEMAMLNMSVNADALPNKPPEKATR
ncbi:MAG: hypothetical protein ACKV2V_08710 [Blastocatellia bacterium]